MMQLKRLWRLFGARTAERTGRHSAGQPYVEVERGEPDPGARATAVLLDRLEPAWTIVYGPWSRRFYAMPLFPTPSPLTVDALTSHALLEQMREAERETTFTGWMRGVVPSAA
ncbi:hypothetical protein Sme01_60340 [Sphaerisporangium melleum]|uniref:Uncharacterized protein n=1 Tax=Sphaerisporangium melleum TaxID=321316 RepID=A0A917VNM9_9ACTN|nr:hypothetical protein [Sphaerisporangium melleum]GGK99125.1 hypothetical protein GCM10007964_46530 [Sphaerisporangium melleum]GII73558.1 hypothetical protein Sme01_60340 [Sphaerisporangium melleum]